LLRSAAAQQRSSAAAQQRSTLGKKPKKPKKQKNATSFYMAGCIFCRRAPASVPAPYRRRRKKNAAWRFIKKKNHLRIKGKAFFT
jgi:hypothetical protein